MVLGQDTKWITGAAGAVIRDVRLVLRFNLSLHREAGTEPQQLVSACRNTLALLESPCSDPQHQVAAVTRGCL